jgi:hypothetical protein
MSLQHSGGGLRNQFSSGGLGAGGCWVGSGGCWSGVCMCEALDSVRNLIKARNRTQVGTETPR